MKSSESFTVQQEHKVKIFSTGNTIVSKNEIVRCKTLVYARGKN